MNRQNKTPDIRSFGAPQPTDREIDLAAGERRWSIAEETPVAFIYNKRNYAVMLATPGDIADFAIGFSLSERVVESLNQIDWIEIHYGEAGVDIRFSIASGALERFDLRQQRRNLVGRAGCGVCGVENADVFIEKLPVVSDKKMAPGRSALLRAVRDLPSHQPLNALTRSVHAAAWADHEGRILLAREDVGRHNALDKLVGARACARANASGSAGDGFLVMSSRCSFEIVEKAARAGMGAIVSVSAPTAFAIRKAQEANIALFALSDGHIVAF
ncbi:MAG: formate dehydrogenase accessory sulfurtransferase FdhD [Parvularculaceae bacterium]|nr:formate dehydrogenase accessory sulfurtransferase FdhD [Parvularculaceae bacterium]